MALIRAGSRDDCLGLFFLLVASLTLTTVRNPSPLLEKWVTAIDLEVVMVAMAGMEEAEAEEGQLFPKQTAPFTTEDPNGQ